MLVFGPLGPGLAAAPAGPLASPLSGVAGPGVAREASSASSQIGELEAQLQSEDEDRRRSAVRALAELGHPDAWRLVLQALSDPSPKVGDEAQRWIPGADQKTRERLLGREGLTSKQDLVRQRVAEALGRMERLAPSELAAALSDDLAEVRRLAAYSFERLARRSGLISPAGPKDRAALDALQRLVSKDRDPEVRAAARVACVFLEAPAAFLGSNTDGTAPQSQEWPNAAAWNWLSKALDERDPIARAAGGVGLGGLADVLGRGREAGPGISDSQVVWFAGQEAQLLSLGGRLLGDKSQNVRLCAVRGLANYPSRAVLTLLIQQLGVEREALSKQALVAALQCASGLFHRADTRPWNHWLEGLPEDFFGRRGAPISSDEAGGSSARLVGLPIPPGPVALLIDMSGSMWNKDDQGRTMKQLVDGELARCLESLSEGSSFLLIPYATLPEAFAPHLTTATPKKVAQAVQWFADLTLRGKGNLWDAVQTARASDPVDSIAIFSDGAPTGGPHWDMELMVELLLEQNRFRATVFNAVLTEQRSKKLSQAWTRLCNETGGRLVEARFEDR